MFIPSSACHEDVTIKMTIEKLFFDSCVMPEDERLMLKLLHHLMRAQLAASANPRKLLRQKNCAFSRLYKAQWITFEFGGL